MMPASAIHSGNRLYRSRKRVNFFLLAVSSLELAFGLGTDADDTERHGHKPERNLEGAEDDGVNQPGRDAPADPGHLEAARQDDGRSTRRS